MWIDTMLHGFGLARLKELRQEMHQRELLQLKLKSTETILANERRATDLLFAASSNGTVIEASTHPTPDNAEKIHRLNLRMNEVFHYRQRRGDVFDGALITVFKQRALVAFLNVAAKKIQELVNSIEPGAFNHSEVVTNDKPISPADPAPVSGDYVDTSAQGDGTGSGAADAGGKKPDKTVVRGRKAAPSRKAPRPGNKSGRRVK